MRRKPNSFLEFSHAEGFPSGGIFNQPIGALDSHTQSKEDENDNFEQRGIIIGQIYKIIRV
jgi:hypothetical protein